MSTDLMKETLTPNPLCTPEQFKQRKIPLFTDAQAFEFAPHSKQYLFDGSEHIFSKISV